MSKRIPLRQCVGCGEMKGKNELWRVLENEEGLLFLDTTGKKNGRGAYLCKNERCLCKAQKSKGLERSLKIRVSQEVYQKLATELEKEMGNIEAG